MTRIKKGIIAMLCVCCMSSSFEPFLQVNAATLETKQEEENERKTPSGIPLEELEEYCDERIIPALEHEIPGLSIAVVHQGEIVFEKGYGYADIERKIPSDVKNTVYEYGSVTKLFTWSSAMKLYEQGKLDLNEDIRTYLPEDFVLPLSYEKPITMLDLMNHQGGFGDYLIHLFSKEEDLVSLREALEENKVDQYYEPGFAGCYSNYGACLAGYIVECVSGMPMHQFVKEEILDVAGMENVTIEPQLSAYPQLKAAKSKVYEFVDGVWEEQNATYVPMYPAGSANGTVESLADFAKALLDFEEHPIFEQEETQKEMLSTSYHAAEGVPGIAHGFIEYDGEVPVYWHDGGTDHSSTFFAIVPERDFGVVICTNTGSKGIRMIQKLGFDMVKKQQPSKEISASNELLPDARLVEGDYQDFREDRKGILRMLTFTRCFDPLKVRAINEKQITIDGKLHTQIAPYIFVNEEDGTKCGFVVENGEVIKYSDKLDYLPVSRSTQIKAVLQAAVFVVLILSILINVVSFIIALIRKKAGKDYVFSLSIIIAWGVIVVNMLRIVGMVTDWATFETIKGAIVWNCILGIMIGIVSIAGLLKKIRDYIGMKKKSEKQVGTMTIFGWQQIWFYMVSLISLFVCTSLGMFCLLK